MNIQDSHIERIQLVLKSKGLKDEALINSLTDHLCCIIEELEYIDFEEALTLSLQKFEINEFENIQILTDTINKNSMNMMKKSIFLTGYIATAFCTSGLLFKVQHWQGASILLVLGIAILNCVFLPLWFYDRYKQSKV